MGWTDSTTAIAGPGGCRQVDSHQARTLLSDHNALVIDVREPHEYAAGRIPDAELIPLRQIAYQVENLKQHTGRPIIISCRSGNRSEMACRFLRESGVENVFNLAGGVAGWARANLDLVQ